MNGKHLFSILTGIVVIGGFALLISKLLSDTKETSVRNTTGESTTKEAKNSDTSAKNVDFDHSIPISINNIKNRHQIAADEVSETLNDIATETIKNSNNKNDEKIDGIFEELNNL